MIPSFHFTFFAFPESALKVTINNLRLGAAPACSSKDGTCDRSTMNRLTAGFAARRLYLLDIPLDFVA